MRNGSVFKNRHPCKIMGLNLSSRDMMKPLRILRQFSTIRIPLYNSSSEGCIFLRSCSVFKNMHPCKIMELTLSSRDMMKLLRILRHFSTIRIPLYNSNLEGCTFLSSVLVFKNMHPCKIMGLTLSSGDMMKLLRILIHFSPIRIPLYNSSSEGRTFLSSVSVFKNMHPCKIMELTLLSRDMMKPLRI